MLPRAVPLSVAVDRFLQVSLLGMLAAGYLAVATSGALDAPTLVVTGAAILARALMVAGLARPFLSDTAATILAIAYIGFYPIDYYFLSREFLASTVHLVLFLAAALIVKASTPRDFFFVKLIAFLELLAASILSTGLSFLLYLAVFLLCAVAAQVSGELHLHLRSRRAVPQHGIRGAHRRLAGVTLFLLTGIAVTAVGLFFVLPRTARAALQHLLPETYHLSGFSNVVTLGQIGRLRMSSAAVMNVRLYNPPPRVSLKWRGTALRLFDGKRWFNETDRGERLPTVEGRVRRASDDPYGQRGRRIIYDVQLRPGSDVLFVAGSPQYLGIDAQVVRTSVDGYRLAAAPAGSLRYQVHSILEDPDLPPAAVAPLSRADRDTYLRTPLTLDSRIADLARRLAASGANDLDRAQAIERHLRTSYGYTTDLLTAEVPDPLAHFLFVRRRGHCEYFASAMTVMLRAAGIPSRVANGFQGGTYNPISDRYLIRASDAHSWVEAWIPGHGWLTFDPTPADPAAGRETMWSRAMLYFDAVEVFWQDWILSYDLERQILLAGRMGQSGRTMSADWFRRFRQSNLSWDSLQPADLLPLAIALAGSAAWLVLAVRFGPRAWLWWKTRLRVQKLLRSAGSPSDATVLYQRMLVLLKRRGVQKPGWVTPREFCDMIPAGDARSIVADITREYNALRFGARGDAAPRMAALLDRLERAP